MKSNLISIFFSSFLAFCILTVILSKCLKKKYLFFLVNNERLIELCKKKFPIFYYLLPIVYILSFMAMLYFYETKIIYYDMVSQSIDKIPNAELNHVDDESALDRYLRYRFLFVACHYISFSTLSLMVIIVVYIIYKAANSVDFRSSSSSRKR